MRSLAAVDVSRFLKEKRERKAFRRNHRKWRAASNQSDQEEIDAHYGEHSTVIRLLADGLVPSARAVRKRRVIFEAPENFSIIENPDECLDALRRLAADLLVEKPRSIHINLGKVKQYDVGANAILDVLVAEVSFKARKERRKVRWTGQYPADKKLKRLIRALGVIKKLQIVHEYPEPEEAAKLEAFDDRCRHYMRAVRLTEVDKKSRVTQQFADHLSGCLERVGRQFTPAARHLLCRYIGEILDNAEEHAGMMDWSIQGYLDTHRAPWVCEIVLFNFGKTFSQNFRDLDSDSYTRDMISRYVESHSKKQLFKKSWNPDDLYTLIALQQHVSTKNYTKDDTRGNGTYDLMMFFERVCSECLAEGSALNPIMTLISGGTRILFDGRYRMKPNGAGSGVIAFNDANDLHQKPDPTSVMHMDSATFPGTVLSIKFPISAEQATTVPSTGTPS
ncbi:hypothetical protein V9K97_02215 [Variovorax sp. CCNWLW186]|uniref:hypothetical protein n=1 Tax=Variovorax sp. CCNWLW186 TaxID=3127473 RepID=UPI0030776F8F